MSQNPHDDSAGIDSEDSKDASAQLAEQNRFSARFKRYSKVGAGAATVASKVAFEKLTGGNLADSKNAEFIANSLGKIKGPVMKLAQLAAAIPGVIPPQWEPVLAQLQANAPKMGRRFVERRMINELGKNWREFFSEFDNENAHAASLGQVHRATSLEGNPLAVKLQYPDMASAVEADLSQFRLVLKLISTSGLPLDLSDAEVELSARLREELDYIEESKRMQVYHHIFSDDWQLSSPQPVAELSTARLLTMNWMEGEPIRNFDDANQSVRNGIAVAAFRAWWSPLFSHAVIHGDPHPGNYLVSPQLDAGITGAQTANIEKQLTNYGEIAPVQISLLDFGCVRFFDASFVQGVIDLYQAVKNDDKEFAAETFRLWGYKNISKEMADVMYVWAKFLYAALITDAEFDCADAKNSASYGREQAMFVHQELSKLGVLKLPREFILLDRAALGMGGLFMRMRAKLNFHRIFEEMIAGFDIDATNAKGDAIRSQFAIRQFA